MSEIYIEEANLFRFINDSCNLQAVKTTVEYGIDVKQITDDGAFSVDAELQSEFVLVQIVPLSTSLQK